MIFIVRIFFPFALVTGELNVYFITIIIGGVYFPSRGEVRVILDFLCGVFCLKRGSWDASVSENVMGIYTFR